MTERYNASETTRNPKVLKNPKGYDRVKDRKNKELYDYEDEEEIDFEQNAENVF